MTKKIVSEKEVLNANKNIIEKFKNMSFYELDCLISIMEEKANKFKEEIDFKLYSNSIDEIDIITLNDYKEQNFQKRTFIIGIKKLKYSQSFKDFNIIKK
ncbi:hypothetical protein [uncultured Lacinutrix sp.]|uniref:hypothetical protein n=1 Tax=uncultured Lacinutrix sp. TaxID=574032 RepID=UPI002611D63D|nr:hypothetical protein [uncultured Lacinutrix sp.]